MKDQLERLLQLSEQSHVTLQVIPFKAGAHPGMPGSFVLIDFPDPADPSLVYIDSMGGDLFLEAEVDVRRYEQSFDHLRAMALSPGASANLVSDVMQDIN